MQTKECRVCGKSKALAQFHLDRGRPRTLCKSCAAAAGRKRTGVVDNPEMKRCRKCGEAKPLNCFYKNPNGDRGLYSVCKTCHKAQTTAYRQANPDVGRNATRKWASSHPGYRWQTELRLRFGMTKADYERMLAEQNGVCAICHGPETKKTAGGRIRHLAVDHCHESNVVRGLLCCDCNQLLGKVNDDPARLRRAADYIERSGRAARKHQRGHSPP